VRKEPIVTELHDIQTDLKARFAISEPNRQRPELLFLTAEAEEARNLIRELKERHGFSHLVLITAVDYIEEGRFQLTYLLHNYRLAADIGLRVYLPREETEMESIHDLWAQAATYQRELKEMFGIHFPGSPRVDEPFILENWDTTPPMRREFDTKKYSEETYFPRPGRDGKEPAEHMKKTLYPEEF
jgi:NADH-quinone oxidoreductase subunit C